LGSSSRCRAIASDPQRRRSLYISLLDSNMISAFIRYCSVRSTTASGCASDKRRNKDTSSPPLRASRLLTCRRISYYRFHGVAYACAYQRRQLEVIANKHEGLCEAQRTYTSRECYLGGFIHNAVVKGSSGKQFAERNSLLSDNNRLTGLDSLIDRQSGRCYNWWRHELTL
jgi:hypothetical protein